MNIEKELTEKMLDSLSFVESDIKELHRSLTKNNALGAEYVQEIIGQVVTVKQKIERIDTFLKEGEK